jgi:hypothetical protein
VKPEDRTFEVVEITSCLTELEALAKNYLNASRQMDKMLKPLEQAIRSNLAQGVPFSAILRKISNSEELETSGLTIRYDAFRSYCYRHFKSVIEMARERNERPQGQRGNGYRPSITNSLEERRRLQLETGKEL